MHAHGQAEVVTMKELFLKLKPSAVLLLLKDSQQSWYPSKLARESNSSYVHAVNLLAQLRRLGVVSTERKGKQNIYRLTEKGATLASSLDDFSKKCEVAGQEAKAEAERKAAEQKKREEESKKAAEPKKADAAKSSPQASRPEEKQPSQADEKKPDAEKK